MTHHYSTSPQRGRRVAAAIAAIRDVLEQRGGVSSRMDLWCALAHRGARLSPRRLRTLLALMPDVVLDGPLVVRTPTPGSAPGSA